MTELSLIVETPQAGGLGHRFLVPPGFPSESLAAQFAAAVGRASSGDNYIGSTWKVEQRLQNGTSRTADEIIVLAGVATRKLNKSQTKDVKDLLVRAHKKVVNLVKEINWSTDGQQLLLNLRELAEWIEEEPCLKGVKSVRYEDGPISNFPQLHGNIHKLWLTFRRDSRKISIGLGAIIIFVLACCVLSEQLFQARSTPPAPTQKPSPKPDEPGAKPAEPPKTSDTVNWLRIKELAAKLGCAGREDDVVRSLYRALVWDRRLQAEKDIQDNKGRQSNRLRLSYSYGPPTHATTLEFEVNKILVPKNLSGSDRFLIGEIAKNSGFQGFLKAQDVTTWDDALQVRKWLYKLLQCYNEAKKSADDLKGSSENLAKWQAMKSELRKSEFGRLILLVNEDEVVRLDVTEMFDPLTPVFDRQDIAAYEILERIEKHFESTATVPQWLTDFRDTKRVDQLNKDWEDVQPKVFSDVSRMLGDGLKSTVVRKALDASKMLVDVLSSNPLASPESQDTPFENPPHPDQK